MPAAEPAPERLNDFVIKFANVNGTGSASANTLIMKSIFRSGVPVVGKNYFPSNIQGLPTWYEIRVSADGHLSRTGRVDLMLAMNIETYARDAEEVAPGGYLIYDSTWPRSALLERHDVTVLGVPLARLCNENFDGVRNRILMKNICYAGVLAALIDIDLEVIRTLVSEQYAKKPKLVDANMKAIDLGYSYAKAHLPCPLPLRIRRLDKTRGHVLIDGNTAAGLGCLYAGATVGAWYPITPSTSLMDAFRGFCERYRVDAETGERNYIVLQAEDELAAIGMVIGASWNGARAFTPTSGPGISLMNEFIGLAYYAEVPCVIFDVQRVGPSTGMPTRTQQCDLLLCAYASHGDTRHVLLFPADPAECFTFAGAAFDLAERLQTPVFVLSDLDIGMNDWMVPDLEWDDAYRPDRGKVLSAEELAKLEKFYRYVDKDGDGITYRTLPGVSAKGAYFTRGSGHNQTGRYTEDAAEYAQVVDRLKRKFLTAAKLVPKAVLEGPGNRDVGIISLGSCDAPIREALGRLAREGVALDYLRVRGFPFGFEVESFLSAHAAVLVIEQNRDAQLKSLLTLETAVDKRKLRSILHYDGLPMTADFVAEAVLAALGGAARRAAVAR
ncbi:MAG TPA: 2-oxoacid:acceptor oxidoreductase subunit alpha [Steroidobacteraceae bacterium]|nr:2-oxoacid:acceptor oxidoreductase subunit alpha [Steroidobacteraceae bacterium]